MTISKKILTIPNFLSLLRIILLPFLVVLMIKKNFTLLAIFLIIYAMSDFFDGMTARMFDSETEFGAKLDSLADELGNTVIFTLFFIIFFQYIKNYLLPLVLIALMFLAEIIIKNFRLKNIGLHLYSGKLGQTYFLSLIIFTLLFGFNSLLVNIGLIIGFMHLSETLIIITFFRPDSKTRSLYDLLRKT